MAVFVLDKHKKPLMPCSEKRARLLLERGRAVVHRMVPFTIRLKDRRREDGALQPVRLTLDPGSRTTGMALVRETERAHPVTGEIRRERAVLALFELFHRGHRIHKRMDQRRAYRRSWRHRKTRYRAPRFDNRQRPDGWLPPSLRHRVDTTMAWVERVRRLAPITGISMERVRFDRQKLQNPEISGVEYQQGTLYGYEVPRGKKAGIHVGRVAVRASGSFNIQTPTGIVQGIHARYCRLLQRADGYGYFVQPNQRRLRFPPPPEGGGSPAQKYDEIESRDPRSRRRRILGRGTRDSGMRHSGRDL